MSTAAATMSPTGFGAATPNNMPAVANGSAMTTTGQDANNAQGGAGQGGMGPGTGMVVGGGPLVQVKQILQQPAVRKSLPAIVALMAVVVLALAYSWMQAPQTRALLPGLQGADLQSAYDSLKQSGFSPEIDEVTGGLKVPQSRFHEARIFLAGQGIPKEPISGLSALNEQNAMTTSQFMEQARYNAAIEQELARSISQISGVQHARVHLATPKQSVFVRDRTPPKASVVITRYAGRSVSEGQVQAIVHLISSSIPYLLPESVTVVDNFGNLMTKSPDTAPLGLTSAQSDHKRLQEDLLRNRVVEILSPVVGEANVRSQVNLTLDFTQIESTTEDYDRGGNGPRTRSEVMAQDRGGKMEAAGVPGSTTNVPPANASVTQNTGITPGEGTTGTADVLSSRTTRNYELDRSVQHVKNAQGGVSRMTVAVVINERPVVLAEGAEPKPGDPTSVPYTDQELERMLNLVRGVVGYNEARGDNVTLMPARFEPVAPLEPLVPWYQDDTVINSFKSGLMTVLLLVFLIIVVRPVIKNLIGPTPEEVMAQAAAAGGKTPDGELSEEDMNMIQIGEGESLEDIKAKLRPKKSSISADMLDTANTYDDKVALIRMLVAEDSGRVANVLKRMIKAS
ncbi:MAG: flagellar basal-body MS-ring/collar protein FliF [Burkholderiaceae bacterium]|jgi:flagellar M-ring protein FliF|nr:flagellar basal-body MS-ring/collar protein FliF [Burkholderiaceae bacterium]